MRWTWTVILGFAVLAAADVAPAQPQTATYVSTTTSDSLAFASVSSRVRVGSQVRVYTTMAPDGPLTLRGRDLLPTGFRIPLTENSSQAAAGSRSLSWAEIREVEVKRDAGTAGAIVGAALFGLGGAAFMYGIAHDEFFNPDHEIGAREVIGAAFLSAIPGALLGAVVGSLIPKWKTVPIAKR